MRHSVRSLRIEPDCVILRLSDGSEHRWDPARTRIAGDRVYAVVKEGMEARFDRHAQASLGEVLEERDGGFVAHIGDKLVPIGASA